MKIINKLPLKMIISESINYPSFLGQKKQHRLQNQRKLISNTFIIIIKSLGNNNEEIIENKKDENNLTIVDYINDEACYNLNNNDILESVQNKNNVVCSLFNDNRHFDNYSSKKIIKKKIKVI